MDTRVWRAVSSVVPPGADDERIQAGALVLVGKSSMALITTQPADWLAGMSGLGPVAWPPPERIRTGRLALRAPEARDRAVFIELLASPEVHTYLGGARPRGELERELPEVPERWPGSFVVELDGAMVGHVLLRRATEHRRPAAVGKVDLGYLFLPGAWGAEQWLGVRAPVVHSA